MADTNKKFTFNVKIDGYDGDTYTVTAPSGNSASHVVARENSELIGRNYTIAHIVKLMQIKILHIS